MSHEEFLADIYSRLSTIIAKKSTKATFSKSSPALFITIRRFDNSLINVQIPQDARVFQLKKAITEHFVEKKINWKTIWKKYALSTSDRRQLLNNNRRVQDYGVSTNCELFFVRLHCSK